MIDTVLDFGQFPIKIKIRDDGRVGNDALQNRCQIGHLGSVLIDGLLYQIVTRRAILTSSFTVVLVFFTAVAATAFDIVSASTLSIRIVTLKRQGSDGVAFARFASVVRESELVGSTRIAS